MSTDDQVAEHVYRDSRDSLLWKPDPSATTTFAEFDAARNLFTDIHHDARWNPWVHDERADEIEQAMEIMGQWHRAEPGFRQLTAKQWSARMARSDRAFKRESERIRQRQERDAEQYDAEREANRLALLEYDSRLSFQAEELSQWQDGSKFYGIKGEQRAQEIEKATTSAAELQAHVDRLEKLVGDPETVVDQWGRLPSDRRETSLMFYRLDRERTVKELKPIVREHTATMKILKGRAARAPIREALRKAQDELDKLLAVPPLTADDMCSECATTAGRHGWSWPRYDHPCRSWPRYAAQCAELRQMFDDMIRQNEERKKTETPPPPKPEPLAVVPSGLPIAEMITRLEGLQAKFPDAEVRRGRASRWELWPASPR